MVRLPSYFTLQNVIPSITERSYVPQVSYSCVPRVILKTGTAEPVGLKSHSGDLAIHWPTSALNCFTEDEDCPPFFWQHWFLSFQAWRNFTHLFCLTTDLCALLIPMLTQFIEMLLQFIGVLPCLPLLEDTIPLMRFGKPQQQAIFFSTHDRLYTGTIWSFNTGTLWSSAWFLIHLTLGTSQTGFRGFEVLPPGTAASTWFAPSEDVCSIVIQLLLLYL